MRKLEGVLELEGARVSFELSQYAPKEIQTYILYEALRVALSRLPARDEPTLGADQLDLVSALESEEADQEPDHTADQEPDRKHV